jgi:hypothetical protein
MKINKTKTLLSMVILLIATTLISSCKYEESPAISLISTKARVAGEWAVEKVTIDGQDITSLFTLENSPVFIFEIDGTWKATVDGTTDDEGTWEFSSSKEDLILKNKNDTGTQQTWTILKLKNKEMWVTITEINPATNQSVKYEFNFMAG